MKESVLVRIGWVVLGTNRVVRAELTHLQGIADVVVDSSPDLDEPAQGPLGVRAAGV